MNDPTSRSSRDSSLTARRGFTLLCQHYYPEMVSTGMLMTELATRLAELGWEVKAYCAEPSWQIDDGQPERVPRRLEYGGVQIQRLWTVGGQRGSLLSRALFAASFTLSAACAVWSRRDSHPTLVITTNPPFLGIVGWLASRLASRPYLLIVHDVYPDIAVNLGVIRARSPLTRVWARATRAMLSEAATVVVIGRDMANVVVRKLPPARRDRIVLIPNWSDERRVRPVPPSENAFRREQKLEKRFVVQYAGRLGRTHGVEELIRAAALLTDADVLFQFVGDGPKKRALETLSTELRLPNVEFLPYQPMERLAETLSAADLAVVCLDPPFTGLSVPSKTYGIMASGTPILAIVDPASEIGQVISETGCGRTLPGATPEQIAQVVRELMARPDLLDAMGRAGRAAFEKRYTLAQAAAAYDRALTALIHARSGQTGHGYRSTPNDSASRA